MQLQAVSCFGYKKQGCIFFCLPLSQRIQLYSGFYFKQLAKMAWTLLQPEVTVVMIQRSLHVQLRFPLESLTAEREEPKVHFNQSL